MTKNKSDFGEDLRIKNSDEFQEETVSIATGSQKRRRSLTQTSIDRYHQRGQITSRQYNTANYIYSLYMKSEKRIISSYNPDSQMSGKSYMVDSKEKGFCEYMDIVKLLPHKLFEIIQHIVIYGFSCNEFDKKYNNKRKTISELRLALDMLADHFRIF